MDNKSTLTQRFFLFGSALSLGLFYTHASASGFQLYEYNATDIGLASAGGAAYAMDASTGFTNPAGLVRIDNPEFVVSGVGIDGTGDFDGTACGGVACTPVPTSDDGGGWSLVPAFHAAMPVGDRVAVGLSVTAPFGLKTDYGTDTAARYSATLSEIQTVDINPNIAFKVTDKFSVGAGVSAQYFDADLNANLTPGVGYPDSQVYNQASDWGYGWNAGMLYQFTPGTRVGVAYRSQVEHDAEGTSKIENGVFINGRSDVSTDITLPPTTILSAYHEFTPNWSLMGSAWYTQWDKIQDVTLKNTMRPTGTLLGPYPNTGPGTVTLPQGFDSTWRLALGSEYKLNDAWILRAGAQHDSTPTNDADRTLRLPESDRWAGSVGAGYRVNKNIKLDAGYEHIWFEDDATINQDGRVAQSYGEVDSSANLFALEATIDIV